MTYINIPPLAPPAVIGQGAGCNKYTTVININAPDLPATDVGSMPVRRLQPPSTHANCKPALTRPAEARSPIQRAQAGLQQADSGPVVVALAGRQRQRFRLKASISNGALEPADAAAGLEPASVAAGLKPAIKVSV